MQSHPSWVRGLKPTEPLKGLSAKLSHPSWVRGLKHGMRRLPPHAKEWSHPSWVRGLKHLVPTEKEGQTDVAPLVGAWIETVPGSDESQAHPVAPLVGAWIETCVTCRTN